MQLRRLRGHQSSEISYFKIVVNFWSQKSKLTVSARVSFPNNLRNYFNCFSDVQSARMLTNCFAKIQGQNKQSCLIYLKTITDFLRSQSSALTLKSIRENKLRECFNCDYLLIVKLPKIESFTHVCILCFNPTFYSGGFHPPSNFEAL